MLFKVQATKDTFELNPELKAIEEFARLTSRQMDYVILSTDYTSPFKKLPSDEKRFQAAVTAGYKFEKGATNRLDQNGRNLIQGKVGSVQAAVNKYQEMQKDDDREALLSVSYLITQVKDFNNKPDKTAQELAAAVKMTVDSLPKLMETKRKVENILDMRDDEPVDESIGGNDDDDTISEDNLPFLSVYNQQFNA